MNGVTTFVGNQEVANLPSQMATLADRPASSKSLRQSVREALQSYFLQLEGQTPNDVYNMVLAQVEHPMIEMVLQHTGGNQSRAAKILGISRGTLRKKMAQYSLFDKN